MPKLNDHGLGGGGKSLGVPVYPLETVEVMKEDNVNGTFSSSLVEPLEVPSVYIYEHASCSIGDDIYFIGTMTGNTYCRKYNVKTRVWTTLANCHDDSLKAWAVAKGTDIYYGSYSIVNVYKYDTLRNTHSSFVSAPRNFNGGCACVDGDYIYTFGGGATTTKRNLTYRIQISTGTIQELTNMPAQFYQHRVVNGANGYVYIFGGENTPTKTYKYSITNDAYTELATIPLSYYKAPIAKINNYVYLFDTGNSATVSLYQYNILSNTYTKITDSRTVSRRAGHANVVDGLIYLIGGSESKATLSGESLLIMRAVTISVSMLKLIKGVKCYTDGDVMVGNINKIGDRLVFEGGTALDKTNGVVTIPNNGEYVMVSSNYATIGG